MGVWVDVRLRTDPAIAAVSTAAKTVTRLYGYPKPIVMVCTCHAIAGGAVLLMSFGYRMGTLCLRDHGS